MCFWMQSGFALLEAGAVSSKNVCNILIKNLFDASIAAIMWWVSGHAFAYGGGDRFGATGENGFAGTQGFFYEYNAKGKQDLQLRGKSFFLFQWTFAGASATIVSGAVAERCSFVAYLSYATLLTGFVYPVIVHATWSEDGRFSAFRAVEADSAPRKTAGRLLGGCGVIDFAGSGTVHLTGGVAAFVACCFVGPRTGRFTDPNWTPPRPQVVYQVLGCMILWCGWYGFNGASTLAIVGYSGVAAHAMMTTTVAAATSCLATSMISYLNHRKLNPQQVTNGVLAGLVGITSSCSTCSIWGAFFIGLFAGPVYLVSTLLITNVFRLDDVVDAISIHGVCGAYGLIVPALFATPYYYGVTYDSERKERCAGVFYGGNPAGSLKAAVATFAAIVVAVATSMAILFASLRALNLHRVSPLAERIGLDQTNHISLVPRVNSVRELPESNNPPNKDEGPTTSRQDTSSDLPGNSTSDDAQQQQQQPNGKVLPAGSYCDDNGKNHDDNDNLESRLTVNTTEAS